MHQKEVTSPQIQSPNKTLIDTPFFNKPEFQKENQSKLNNLCLKKYLHSQQLSQQCQHSIQGQNTDEYCMNSYNPYKQTRSHENSCGNCARYRVEIGKLYDLNQQANKQLMQKISIIASFQKQNGQLKLQQQYLIKAIQQLRDQRKNDTASTVVSTSYTEIDVKYDKVYKLKVQELNHARKQIVKLKEWLKQEKAQAFRCLQCVKIKDQIIKNLQNQIQKLKSKNEPKSQRQTKQKKKPKRIQNASKLNDQDQLSKYKRKSRQLQEHVYQLTQQLDNMRNDNCNLKQEISRISSYQGNGNINANSVQDIGSPILRLKQSFKISPDLSKDISISNAFESSKQRNKQKYNEKQSQNQKKLFKLLSKKCLQLQTQIQKLLLKVQRLKYQNDNLKTLQKNQYSFANLQAPKEILKEDRLPF